MEKLKIILVALFIFLLLPRNVHAVSSCPQIFIAFRTPWYCSQIDQATTAIWSQWAPIAGIAAVFAVLVAAMIYIFGITARNEGIKSFAIGELYEAVTTAFIAVFFLLLCAVLFGVIPSFVTGPLNPYNTTLNYINNVVVATQTLLTQLYNTIVVDSYYASVTLSIYTGAKYAGGFYSGATANAITDILNPLAQAVFTFFVIPAQSLSGLLIDGLMALYAEFYFVLFFMYTAIPVFLIPGIIMRAIFPLRAVGGLLIAISIAFFLIMPILFSVAFTITTPGAAQKLNYQSALLQAGSSGNSAQTNGASADAPLALALQDVSSSMGGYFLAVVFYPALILALTYISMNILAEFIGGASQTTKRMGLV